MSAGIPRIYTSFAEFEREELRRLDSLHTSVDDLVVTFSAKIFGHVGGVGLDTARVEREYRLVK